MKIWQIYVNYRTEVDALVFFLLATEERCHVWFDFFHLQFKYGRQSSALSSLTSVKPMVAICCGFQLPWLTFYWLTSLKGNYSNFNCSVVYYCVILNTLFPYSNWRRILSLTLCTANWKVLMVKNSLFNLINWWWVEAGDRGSNWIYH